VTGPNHDAVNVQKTADALRAAGLPARIMIDTSHGNSSKDHRKQPRVAHEIAEQVSLGEAAIFGVMIESFLVDGRQDLVDPRTLRYGQSITDACIGWEATGPVLGELAAAVRTRRRTQGARSRS
jgi:3-deoxy-7-phosphoheptulonate synthase